MAEEKAENAENEEEGKGLSKKKKTMILIIGLGVLLVIGAVGVGLVLGKKSVPEETGPIKKNEVPVMALFPEIYVNISETKATRVLKLSIAMTVSESTLLEVIEAHRPIVLDMISEVASYMTIEELEGRSGRGILKREIKTRINDLLRGQGKGAVDDIYFTDFLIQ
jgi:flagellar basal body-associated protein FliL